MLWEGFIRCVKLKQSWPYAFDVLLRLPQREFKKVLDASPELVVPFRNYVVNTLGSHASSSLMSILESAYNKAQKQH